MKKRTAAALIAAIIALSGCSDFFEDEKPKEVSTGEVTHTQSPTDTDTSAAEALSRIELPPAAAYYLKEEDAKTVSACKAIYDAMANSRSSVDLSGLDVMRDDVDPMIMLLVSACPRLGCVSESYSYTVSDGGRVKTLTINYTADAEEIAKMDEELMQAAQEIVAQGEGLTPEERAQLYHDSLVLGCEYSDESPNCYSAYGCLVEGKAVCEGYSKAFLLLCELGDIDCLTVLGDTLEESGSTPHMWNKLNLGGEWYNVDVTWDDPISNIEGGYLRYDYYNITDEELLRDHSFDDSGFIRSPEALGTACNYFSANGLLITETDAAAEIMTDAIADTVSKGGTITEVKAADGDVYSWVCEQILSGDDPAIFDILDDAAEQSGTAFVTDSYTVLKNQSQNTIAIMTSFP